MHHNVARAIYAAKVSLISLQYVFFRTNHLIWEIITKGYQSSAAGLYEKICFIANLFYSIECTLTLH